MNQSMKDCQKGGKGMGSKGCGSAGERDAEKKGQCMSQQEMSDKLFNNTRPARLKIDEYEGNDMQVDDEGMRGNEEREEMERTERKNRHNEARKAVKNSTKRKTHEKGNNLALERYVTCDIAFVGFVSHCHESHLNSYLFHSLLQTASKKNNVPHPYLQTIAHSASWVFFPTGNTTTVLVHQRPSEFSDSLKKSDGLKMTENMVSSLSDDLIV